MLSSNKDPEAPQASSATTMANEKQPLLVPTTTTTTTTAKSTTKGGDGQQQQQHNQNYNNTIWNDAKDTLFLGIPIFLSMLSWVGMKTTDSALLGHVSANALSAAALSDLWTMCTGILINARVLGVLCSGAVGAGNPKLAGIYLQVSFFVLVFPLVFVFVCWYLTGVVWTIFGSDVHLVQMAALYAQILAWSLPGQLIMTQVSQFFSSQRIMQPEVNASAIALTLNLILGLIFVLGIPIPGWSGFGFPACPTVTAIVVYVQVAVLLGVYVFWKRLHEPCWDGWAYTEITWERIKTFCDLYIPAAMGSASDFWRVAVIGTVAAKLGNTEVAVFNTSYRIMWIVLILINALSTASGIKTSTRLGKMDHKGAKQAGWMGIYMSAAVLLVIGSFVVWKIRWFGRIFTEDEEFLDFFSEARVPFTVTLVLMNLSVAIERIPYSMGRTKIVFWSGFVASWGAQVPGVIVLTTYWRDDLVGLYWGMGLGYLVLTLLYGWIVLRSDWVKYAELARQRSEMSDDK